MKTYILKIHGSTTHHYIEASSEEEAVKILRQREPQGGTVCRVSMDIIEKQQNTPL